MVWTSHEKPKFITRLRKKDHFLGPSLHRTISRSWPHLRNLGRLVPRRSGVWLVPRRWFQSRWRNPQGGGSYGPPRKRHLWVCAIYVGTTVKGTPKTKQTHAQQLEVLWWQGLSGYPTFNQHSVANTGPVSKAQPRWRG